MKPKKQQLLMLFVIALFIVSSTFAKNKFQKYIGKTYFVKHNLIFPETHPKIYPGKILFIHIEPPCDAIITGFSISKGAGIKILQMCREKDFIEVVMEAGKWGNYSVLLKVNEVGDFKRSFKEIFSKKSVEYSPHYCKLETPKDLIKCFGYPIYECEKNGTKIWYYNEQYTGTRIFSFHDCWLEIKNGKITKPYGYL